MQDAKDTFYITLRNRLAVINPSRIMSLRAVTRPSIYVADSESPAVMAPDDTFILSWTGTSLNTAAYPPIASLTCQISYSTGGSQGYNGLDRGRAMTAMDQELVSMLTPQRAVLTGYTAATPVALGVFAFWTSPVFQPIENLREQLTRRAEVTVFSVYKEGV